MPKLIALTVLQLKAILRAHDLPSQGLKSELVSRLIQETGSDEIDTVSLADILPTNNDNIRQELDALKTMIAKMTATMEKITNPEINNIPDARQADDELSSVGDNINENELSNSIDDNGSISGFNANTIGVQNAHPTHTTKLQNVRDVMAILPEFDPSKEHLSAQQFVDKIEGLSLTYGWHEHIRLYATQSKLKGHAKTWIDAQPVFNKWKDFVRNFLHDFPCIIVMVKTHQTRFETITDYYYRMLATGRKGKLDDASIIRHTINGLIDENARRTLNAMNFNNCPEFFKALNGMLQNKSQFQQNVFEPRPKRFESNNHKSTTPKPHHKGPVCYNCNEPGHISINCTQPSRRGRCTKCNKVHPKGQHETCEKQTIKKVELRNKANIFEQVVKIANAEYTAYVDTGSECHLIRRACMKLLPYIPQPCCIKLNGLWGGACTIRQKIVAPVEMDGLTFHLTLCVVDDEQLNTDLLLGCGIFTNGDVTATINHDKLCFSTPSAIMKNSLDQSNKNALQINDIQTGLVDEETGKELLNIVNEYRNLFAGGLPDLGKTDLVEMTIKLSQDSPIAQRAYRVPEPKKEIVRKMISELLENNIIEESTSEYASPMLLVKKKNGTERLCVDYRLLNKHTIREVFPTPNIEEIIQEAKRYKFYTSLDLNSGFYQIPIDNGSQKYTAFVTPDGLYQFKRVPFGLTNAPAVFQRLMAKICKMLPHDDIMCYMDDILIGSNTKQEMMDKVRRVFDVLQQTNLTLNLGKCTFMTTKIEFLGHQLTPNGIEPGKLKTIAISSFPKPINVNEVRRFLGLSGYFRKFVPGYAIISEPLRQLLKKDQPFHWNQPQQDSFERLKTTLTSQPVLTGYKTEYEHEIHTDASAIGIAGVLMQSEGTHLKPVAYYSRSTTACETKYHSYELETLAVVETLARFRYYIYGKKVKVITDCSAVTTLMTKRELIPRIARWCLKIQDYDIELQHRTGQQMPHVDALSRAPVEDPHEVDTADMLVAKVHIDNEDWLYSMQMQDAQLRDIVNKIDKKDKEMTENYVVKSGRLFRKQHDKTTWVVPKSLRWKVVHDSHDKAGHLSVEKTLERLNSNFWFARMRNFVKSYIKSCVDCAYNKDVGGQVGIEYHFTSIEPIPYKVIHIDHLGPFPISKKRNQHVIVIIDAFTKFVMIRAVKNTSTRYVIDALNELGNFVGMPEVIVSDRGTAFTSREFQNYCKASHIKHQLNAVRTPRANGQVERLNRTLLSMLTTMTKEDAVWDEQLREIQWSLNTMKSSSTGCTPHQLLYNFTPKDMLKNKLILALHDSQPVTMETLQQRREQAAKRFNEKRNQAKFRFDARHAKPKRYEVGDLVLAETESVSIGHSRKLEPRYKGPFLITKDLGKDRYVVEDLPKTRRTKRHYTSVYSSDKLKPWCNLPDEIYDSEDDDDVDEDAYEEDGRAVTTMATPATEEP